MSFRLPDEVWAKILRDWVQEAVDWAQWAQTCRHFYYRLPRPRPIQLVTEKIRYPHVIFLEEIVSRDEVTFRTDESRLLCFNTSANEPGRNTEEEEEENLMNLVCSEGKQFRIFTYCEGDKAYLEPSYYNSSFHCERGQREERESEGYGLVFHYEASAVKQVYGTTYHTNYYCFWRFRRRSDSPEWMELQYGNEESSMSVDFDSFFKAFLLIDESIWIHCRLEDYRADLAFFLSRTPAFWHEQWRQRFYQALPCQPLPIVSHSYQTNLFAPGSWDDIDFAHDDIMDFLLTGQRTAKVLFSMELRDSHIIIQSPPQSFALRLPLLQHDLEIFHSQDPAAWLLHLYERRSRRWFVARKYWRLAADVQETHREVSAEAATRDWPVMHPDYVYRVDDDGNFLLELPSVPVAKDVDTGEYIQQASETSVPNDKFWCIVLHG